MKPINFRYLVGSTLNRASNELLSFRAFPLTRVVPHGFSPWYDAQRIAGSRQLQTIFDVGANIGQTAVGLVQYFPDASIHCFEPASEPYKILKLRAGRWQNVQTHQLAIGDSRNVLEMAVRSGASSELNTFVASTRDDNNVCTKEMVPVETIDQVCSQMAISGIDILKLDVQGWEMKVLAGASEMFRRHRVRFVFTEAAFTADAKEMVSFAEIHADMTSRGFVLAGIYDCFRWGAKAEIYFCNCLYLDQLATTGQKS